MAKCEPSSHAIGVTMVDMTDGSNIDIHFVAIDGATNCILHHLGHWFLLSRGNKHNSRIVLAVPVAMMLRRRACQAFS